MSDREQVVIYIKFKEGYAPDAYLESPPEHTIEMSWLSRHHAYRHIHNRLLAGERFVRGPRGAVINTDGITAVWYEKKREA